MLRGVGPWRRQGTGRFRAVRLAVVTVAITAGLLSLVEVVLVVAGPAEPTWLVVLFPLLGVIYVAAGTVAWLRRPSNQVGALLVLGGVSWLMASLGNTEPAALIAVGQVTATVPLAVIVHTLMAFPSGRLRDRGSRLTVAAAYVTALLLQAPLYLFTPEVPPYDPLKVADRPDLAGAGLWCQRVVGSAVMVGAAVVLWRRLRAASPAQRHVLGPLYVYGILAVLFVPLTPNVVQPLLGVSVLTAIALQLAVLAVVPLAFALSILRGGFARTAEVEELGAWLGTDVGGRPTVRDALAEALGDPSVSLAFWSPAGGCFIDDRGRGIGPLPTGQGRAAIEIRRDATAVAVIEYDATLIGDPALVRAAGEVVTLALERDQLTANLSLSQEALRESRVRIMEAGDEERRRIAQDLHDGLQTRLVLLGIAASSAGATQLQASVDVAVGELRSLVHGILPPVLMDRGLYAAIEDLVDHVSIPVVLELPATPSRLAPTVERAAYFVVAEALTNAVKHSRARRLTVRLDRADDELRINVCDDGVGGAAPTGAGLRGIADRVDVLGGRLSVDSRHGAGTTLEAVVPCAS